MPGTIIILNSRRVISEFFAWHEWGYSHKKRGRPNLGRGRELHGRPQLHWTVKERMDKVKGYKLRATLRGEVSYEGKEDPTIVPRVP